MNWDIIAQNESIDWDQDLINTYKDVLEWDYLSTNSKAFKNADLIDEFVDKIIWEDDSMYSTIASNEGLVWSINFIDKYESKLDFHQLSLNPAVQWSEKLIDKYFDRWDFTSLRANSQLPWSVEFLQKYFNKTDLKTFEFGYYKSNACLMDLVEAYPQDVDLWYISSSTNLPWFEQNLLEKWGEKLNWKGIALNEFLFRDGNFFESHLDKWLDEPKTKFRLLSHNKELPWTYAFIDRFTEYWDWETLSENPSLPWSTTFIKNYEDRLVWGGYENKEHLIIKDDDQPILGTYNQGLILNQGLPWSIDFLKHYEDKLDFEMLYYNSSVWGKAFKSHMNSNIIETVLKLL